MHICGLEEETVFPRDSPSFANTVENLSYGIYNSIVSKQVVWLCAIITGEIQMKLFQIVDSSLM